MRIENKIKRPVVKIIIKKQKLPSETLTVSDTDIDELFAFVKKSVKEIALSTPEGYRTSIMLREYEDNKFKVTLSTSIFGSDPSDVKEFLEEKIRSNQAKPPLPDFLYNDNGEVRIGAQGDSVVTTEWNKFLNKYI